MSQTKGRVKGVVLKYSKRRYTL